MPSIYSISPGITADFFNFSISDSKAVMRSVLAPILAVEASKRLRKSSRSFSSTIQRDFQLASAAACLACSS